MPQASSLVRRLAALLPLLLTAGLAAQIPAGYRIHEDEEHGFRWGVHPSFDPLPTQPTEKQILGRFVQQPSERSRRKGQVERGRPEWFVVQLGSLGETEASEKDEKRTVASRPPVEEAEQRLRTFFQQRRIALGLHEIRRQKASGGRPERIDYELFPSTQRDQKSGPPVGFGRLWCDPQRFAFVFGGTSSGEDYDEVKVLFRRMAASLEAMDRDPEREKDLAKRAEKYEKLGYKQPRYRVEVEDQLVRGWKAIHTENYVIIYDSRDKNLLSILERHLEAMRSFYEQVFPPSEEIEEVSTVRVCKDRDEYLSYGGDRLRGSAGFWNSNTRELVLYDNVKGQQGSKLGNLDSLIVLYHEAFHQYIYYAVGEIAPHSWFNEGYGDYFSGSRISGKTVRSVEVNPWRVNTIKEVVARSKDQGKPEYLSIDRLIHASQAEYYRNGARNYAQGWSFIHFLRESRAVEKNEAWKAILPRYFDTLKQVSSTIPENLSPIDKANQQELARARALSVAFEGIDLPELEEAWVQHVLSLPEVKLR